MPDQITTSSIATIDMSFVDGDSRTITIKNPREDIETSEITDLNAYIQANNLLIGDKDGGTFGRIKTVTKKYIETTSLDIDNPEQS